MQSQSYTTFFRHSAVLSVPVVLLCKLPNEWSRTVFSTGCRDGTVVRAFAPVRPMWPTFNNQILCHMRLEFFCSLYTLYQEVFVHAGTPVFPSPQKLTLDLKEMLYEVRCLKWVRIALSHLNFSGSWDNCLNCPASARVISSFDLIWIDLP